MKTLPMLQGLVLLTATTTGCGALLGSLDSGSPAKAAPQAAAAPTREERYEATMKALSETSCEAYPAVPMARANLAHEDLWLRIQACDILGRYGAKGDIAKVELLGSRDPYRVAAHADGRGRFVESRFPVRERCSAAAVKLRLSSMP